MAISWNGATGTHTIRRDRKTTVFDVGARVTSQSAKTNRQIETDAKTAIDSQLTRGEVFFLHIINDDWRTADGGRPLQYAILRCEAGFTPPANWWEHIPNPPRL